jgi:hypothetical protein
MAKQIKQITVSVIDDDAGRKTRDGFVALIDQTLASLPLDATNPVFEIEKHEKWYPYESDSHVSARLNLIYSRPETNEEHDIRIATERTNEKVREEMERAEFVRLSKKFKLKRKRLGNGVGSPNVGIGQRLYSLVWKSRCIGQGTIHLGIELT